MNVCVFVYVQMNAHMRGPETSTTSKKTITAIYKTPYITYYVFQRCFCERRNSSRHFVVMVAIFILTGICQSIQSVHAKKR